MPRPKNEPVSESTLERFNKFRAKHGDGPIPNAVETRYKTQLHLYVSIDAATSLEDIARAFGYVTGPKNRANIAQMLEAIGQGLLQVVSAEPEQAP